MSKRRYTRIKEYEPIIISMRESGHTNREIADELGIELGDDVEVTTNIGSLTFKAIPTATVQKGEVFIYHGYKDFDINSILDGTNLDPYSGFPAYRSAFCNIRRK